MLENSLNSVKNKQFIDTFKDQFYRDVLEYNKVYLKQMQNQDSPLFHLLTIEKNFNGENELVNDLINHAASLIEVTNDEIINETFYSPSQHTFIYTVLFNSSFKSSSLYKRVINHLTETYKDWINNGCCVNDVYIYQGFSQEQLNIVEQIWALVTNTQKENLTISTLFKANRREMQAKLEMKDKVVSCLNAYCGHAIDKDLYHQQIREWYNRFQQATTKSAEIPQAFRDILPFANELNPYANASNWRMFVERKLINEPGMI